MRTFTFNVLDVTVSFLEDWADIQDVLEADSSYQLPIDDLLTIARDTAG